MPLSPTLTARFIAALLLLSSFSLVRSSESAFSKLESVAAKIPTMRDLFQRGDLIYENGRIQLKDANNYYKTRLIDFPVFEHAVTVFIKTMKIRLNRPERWMGQVNRLPQILNPTPANFLTYAQKLHLQGGQTFLCKGDLHGDMHSLIAFIRELQTRGYTSTENEFQIVDPHFFLIFLGDYVDRGLWGVEVLALLFTLQIHNPTQVILVRGNHEDPVLTESYGFKTEFFEKFCDVSEERRVELYSMMAQLYNYLPVVLYVGATYGAYTDFVQCCHGGVEMGYNPKELLNNDTKLFETLHEIKRHTVCSQEAFRTCKVSCNEKILKLKDACSDFIPLNPTEPCLIGFVWHDFIVSPEGTSLFTKGRGLQLDKAATEATLADASTARVRLSAIIRAHQHAANNEDPLMKLLLESKGCAVLWQQEELPRLTSGTVITLLLSPDTMMGVPNFLGTNFSGFTYDTALLVSIGEGFAGSSFAHWKLTVINNEIYAKRAILSSPPALEPIARSDSGE